MPPKDPPSFFDKEQAATYDERFVKLSPMLEALHLSMVALLKKLPDDARILCVGAGTGAELLALAKHFPNWTFTAVEPSPPMLDICKQRTQDVGIADRCDYHEGYLDSLPPSEGYHAAASILVSHFLTDPQERQAYFQEIAKRLLPGGLLVSADLSADQSTKEYNRLLEVWMRMLGMTDMPQEKIDEFREAYDTKVAIRSPEIVADLLEASGFANPTHFFQIMLIRAWFAKRV